MKRVHVVGVVGIAASLAAGCVTDKPWTARPVRLNVGVATRHLATPPPTMRDPLDYSNLNRTSNVARSTEPTAGAMESVDAPTTATVGAAEFTLAFKYHTYAGGAIETGTLGQSGSSIAAIYGVLGAEATNSIGAVAVELAAGWQTMRANIYSPDYDTRVLEPRVRGELWLSPQFTLGANIGGMPGGDSNGWTAGVYLGVHSNLWDIWGQQGLPKNNPTDPPHPDTVAPR